MENYISPDQGGLQPKKGKKCSRYKIIGGEYKVIYLKLVDIELSPAPEKVRDLAKSLPMTQLEMIEISDEAFELTDQYLKENIV